jgi:hypothetical protein
VSLHDCEVMLKDIGDSKRMNYTLHSQDGGCPELITQVISGFSVLPSSLYSRSWLGNFSGFSELTEWILRLLTFSEKREFL